MEEFKFPKPSVGFDIEYDRVRTETVSKIVVQMKVQYFRNTKSKEEIVSTEDVNEVIILKSNENNNNDNGNSNASVVVLTTISIIGFFCIAGLTTIITAFIAFKLVSYLKKKETYSQLV